MIDRYEARDCRSPFNGAPVFYTEETGSTMADGEELLQNGGIPGAGGMKNSPVQSGTVLYAGCQSAGVGRIPGRRWDALKGESALFTLLLHREDVDIQPGLFPLLTGLAYSVFLESAYGLDPKIKWPNDVLLRHGGRYKKSAGILSKLKGEWYLLGMGINCRQTKFEAPLADTAVSINMCTGKSADPQDVMLQVLARCRKLHCLPADGTLEKNNFQVEIEKRLLFRGEEAYIKMGRPPNDKTFPALITGVAADGGLRFRTIGTSQDSDREEILYAGEVTSTE
jgi:BirA family transcriptional regulator, biotin operon repressor / biotin---[acetyl-CoA-carboxylase] ligase